MPFDEPEASVFQTLEGALSGFRSALASTIEQVRSLLADAPGANGEAAPGSADLGAFAQGRIDGGRFASLLAKKSVLDAAARGRMEEAFEVLTSLAARKEALFRVHVEPGTSLAHAVGAALAEVGRAFGAARTVELARGGRYDPAEHDGWSTRFPFGLWSAGERRLAPPLVVRVNGTDLHAEGLAPFLDGSQKIVLLVRGDAPPAPLARLVTPGVFVVQAKEPQDLAAFAAAEGPGVAALVPEGCALFRHDPAGGDAAATRVTLDRMPEEGVHAGPLAGWSRFQLEEPLRQLRALAEAGSALPSGGVSATTPDPVDKLAAWLLRQADLTGIE